MDEAMATGARMMTAVLRVLKGRFGNLSVDESVELAGKIVEAVIEAQAPRGSR